MNGVGLKFGIDSAFLRLQIDMNKKRSKSSSNTSACTHQRQAQYFKENLGLKNDFQKQSGSLYCTQCFIAGVGVSKKRSRCKTVLPVKVKKNRNVSKKRSFYTRASKHQGRKTRYFKEHFLHAIFEKKSVTPKDIQDLLADGVDVNKKNCRHKTVLHVEVKKDFPDLEVIRLLLNHGADVNIVDDRKNTVLHCAVIARMSNPSHQVEIVKILLDAGADINALNRDQKAVFNIAMTARVINVNLIKELLKRGANLKLMKKSPLIYAVKKNNFPSYLIKELLDKGARVTPCVLSTYLRNPGWTSQLVHIFISKGINVNYKDIEGLSILHLAVLSKSDHGIAWTRLESVIEVLLDHGANINAKCIARGYTPLMYAARYHDSEEVLEKLLIKGADPNIIKSCNSAMHFAATNLHCNPNFIKTLVQYGGNVNIRDPSWGMTPLQSALSDVYDINLIKELLRNGATLRTPNNYPISSLKIVLRNTNENKSIFPVVQELLKYDPTLMYKYALHECIRNPSVPVEVFDVLVKHGADLFPENQSLLGRVLRFPRSSIEVIKYFLENEAWCTKDDELSWEKTYETISRTETEYYKLIIKYATLQKYACSGIPKLASLLRDLPELLYFESECATEMSKMCDVVAFDNTGTDCVLIRLIGERKGSTIIQSFQDSLLEILTDNKFLIYKDVIARKINKSTLIHYVITQASQIQSNLNGDVIGHIAKYLSNDSILNLILAFNSNSEKKESVPFLKI